MAWSFVAVSSGNGAGLSGGAVAPAYPTGIQDNDLLVLSVVTKYPTVSPATPSGWTAPSGNQKEGGSGASGVDAGNVYTTVFYKVSDGTETGTVSVDVTGANSAYGAIVAYRPTNDAVTFTVECQSGADNTPGTGWSVTTDSALDVQTGDLVVACTGVNGGAIGFSSQSLSLSGATFSSVGDRIDNGSTAGDDCSLNMVEFTVASGSGDATATYTATGSTSGTDWPAGATVLLRVREVVGDAVFSRPTVAATTTVGAVRIAQNTAFGFDPYETVALRTGTEDPYTFSHTPMGTLRGVVVIVAHGVDSTDHVSGITYGGQSLTRVQTNVDTATEPGRTDIWFLGTGIPTGTQTVSVDLASATGTNIGFAVVGFNAGKDVILVDSDGVSEDVANPSVTLTSNGLVCATVGVLYSGTASVSTLVSNSNMTRIGSADEGVYVWVYDRQTTPDTANFTFSYPAIGTEDVAMSAAMFSETNTIDPATVAVTATVGAPTVIIDVSITATTVAASTAIDTPSVTVNDDILVTPSTVAATASLAAVTVNAGAAASPSTVDASTTVSGTALTPVSPGSVAATATVGTVTVTTDSIVSATTVAGSTTIGTPSVSEPVPAVTVAAVTTIGTPLPPRLRYVGTATDSATTTTMAPTVPSGAVGDWLLLMVGVKGGTGPSVVTAGWTELTGAAGTSTNGTAITTDVGDTTTRAYIKKATATSETVSINNGGTIIGISKVFRYTTEPGYNPIFSAVFIDDPTGTTDFGGTSAGSLSVDAGTEIVAAGFIPTDANSGARFSAQSVAISGATISLTQEVLDGGTSAGLDLGTTMTRHTVTAGPGSGTVTYSATQPTGTNGYGAIAVVAISALPIVLPDTVAATTTIGTVVVRELAAIGVGTLGGLTDSTTISEDRFGWSAAITSPVDGSLVTSGGITVAGYVYAADNLEAELHVQVSTSSVFATILDTQFSAPVDLDELATVSLSGLVAGTTYYLRARGGHSATDEWGDWSTTVTVTANVDVGDGYAYLYASDVDTSVPTPHIWWTIYDPETDTVTVVGTGFGATQGTYNGELWTDYEPGGTVELTPTSWTTDADTGNATTGDRTIVYGTSSDPATTTIVADAPTDVDDRGLGVYVDTTGGGGTTGGTVVSYPADIPADRTNTGWWVEVRDFFNPDTILTTIHSFKSLSFTKPLNDAGTGEIVMDRNDPFFDILLTPVTGDEDEGKAILTFALYFSFMQDGAERFRMVYDGKARDRAKASEPETVTLSGTGRAVELSWGVVLPNSWPADVKAHPRKRDNQTWAPLFIKLFNEAQNRGEIPETITLGFTDTHDSYGALWTDQLGESDREVEIGTTLFDLIQTWADAEEFDWIVTPRGRVIAAPVLGQDLTMDVRFFNAVTNNEVGATEDRKDIRTRIYVEGTNGHISYTEGEYPIARWGVRAMYLRSDQARSERQRIRVARGTLRQTRRPARERMVKVPYEHLDPVTGESYGRTVFVDYGLGDIVGFGPRIDNTTGMPRAARDVRVAEIGISVSTEGTEVELTMETRNERFEERVRRLLAARLGEWSSAKTAKQGKGSVTNARDTDVDDVVTGDTIIWDRDAELWKSGRPTDVWPFYFTGALFAMTSKMYFVCDAKRTIRRITARLGDVSTSGPVTIALKRNNATVHTMNIAAGNTRNRDIVTIPVTEDDELSIDVLDPGTNAGYLQVVVEAG